MRLRIGGSAVWRLAPMALVAFALAVFPSSSAGNAGLDAITEIDCNPNQAYGDAGDQAAAAALAADGYTCTALLNKGQLPGSFQHVGELWHKQVGTILRSRVIIFGDNNTGFTDGKFCLDDDPDPINDIAPGGADPNFCLGGDAPLTFAQGADNGPSYPPAKAAGLAPEEGAGKHEIRIDSLIEISEVLGGTVVGGWNINIDGYTEVLPHFNNQIGGDDVSIVAYFQPQPQTQPTATLTVRKNAIPDDGTDFSYTTSGFAPSSFSLEDDGDEATNPSSQTFTFSGADLDAGPETVTEEGESGWTLTDLDCTGDDDFTENGATATLNVESGETIVCVYVNRQDSLPPTGQGPPNGDTGQGGSGGGANTGGGGGRGGDPSSDSDVGADPAGTAAQESSGGTLPLTGLGVLVLLGIGVGLVKSGVAIRVGTMRATRRDARPAPGATLTVSGATVEELRALGMSITQAIRVIRYREEGRLSAWSELDQVPGFPQAFRAELKRKLAQ